MTITKQFLKDKILHSNHIDLVSSRGNKYLCFICEKELFHYIKVYNYTHTKQIKLFRHALKNYSFYTTKIDNLELNILFYNLSYNKDKQNFEKVNVWFDYLKGGIL